VSNNSCSAIVIDRWLRNPSGEKISVELDGNLVRIKAASMLLVLHVSHGPRLEAAISQALVEARLLGVLEPLPEKKP
jgi:hypothetical protein